MTKTIEDQAHGIIGMVHVTKGRLGSVRIPDISDHEQRHITAFLDHETARIDTLIDEQKRLIALLKEKRQAVISHAVTKGLDPNAPMKDSGVEWLGEVPTRWLLMRLKLAADLVTGVTPPTDDLDNYAEEGLPWVRPEDLDDSGRYTEASKYLTPAGWNHCRPVAAGATLICCIGTIGKTGFTARESATNQQITAAVPKNHGRFLFYCLRAAKSELEVAATGNLLKILNSERLGNAWISVPPEREQATIAAFLDHETAKIDALVEQAEDASNLLHERRSALISAAVTGKIDVRGWQPRRAEREPELLQAAEERAAYV